MSATSIWLAGAATAAVGLGLLVGTRAVRPVEFARVPAADTAITSRSIAYFEERLALNPGNFMVESRLINRYILRFGTGARQEDVARAETLARHLVRTGPDAGSALTRLSSVLLMQHKFAEALERATDALRFSPEDQDALGALFDADLAAGRYSEAEATLRRLRPGVVGSQVRRAQWLDASGHSEAAYDALDEVCSRFNHSSSRPQVVAWCLTQLGAIEHVRRGPEAAKAMWRRALKVLPGYRGALEGLASLAQAQGEWNRAQVLYGRIASDAHPDLYLRLAEVSSALGKGELARQYEQRFLAVAGRRENEPLFGLQLAGYYAEQSSPEASDTALALATRDVARRPTVESFDELAWVRFRRREYTEALAASGQAARWGTPSPTMLYHRGRILEALGRPAEAGPLLHQSAARPTLLAPHARRDLALRTAGSS